MAPVEELRRNHPEEWAPPLLQALISVGKAGLQPPIEGCVRWACEDFRPDRLLGPGSWNWDYMIGACVLWLDPDRQITASGRRMSVCDWWQWLLCLQLGETRAGAGDEVLNSFGGTETLSSTYEPFRAGSVNAVRLLALRNQADPRAAALLRLSAGYNQALTALLALGAVPWPDRVVYRGSSGKLWYSGPTVSPVGERSTPAHAWQSDLGPIFALCSGAPLSVSRRETWPTEVVRKVLADPGGKGLGLSAAGVSACLGALAGHQEDLAEVLGLLAGIRLQSAFGWRRYPDGSILATSGPRINFNTPKIFWSYSDPSCQEMKIGFPWSGGRHRREPGAGSCEVLSDPPRVVATATKKAIQSLPAEPPVWNVAGGLQGVSIVRPEGR